MQLPTEAELHAALKAELLKGMPSEPERPLIEGFLHKPMPTGYRGPVMSLENMV